MGLTLLLGGARSGKSALAIQLGATSDREVVFVATAEAADDDMAERIGRHRAERPQTWRTIEEPEALIATIAAVDLSACVIVDCLTLWVSNLLRRGFEPQRVTSDAAELARLLALRDECIVISNEVGMGVHPATELGRSYRDLLGRVNVAVANEATKAYLVVAGRLLPLVKPDKGIM